LGKRKKGERKKSDSHERKGEGTVVFWGRGRTLRRGAGPDVHVLKEKKRKGRRGGEKRTSSPAKLAKQGRKGGTISFHFSEGEEKTGWVRLGGEFSMRRHGAPIKSPGPEKIRP